MNIIVASDSFKGTYSSTQIGELVRCRLPMHDVRVVAVSDGGEGFCCAAAAALSARLVQTEVHDPLMRTINASYCIAPDGMAVIEMAQASGLMLLNEQERNPWNATTYGTGELIRHALSQGCRHIVVGLGGSATNDCGRGMLEALDGAEGLDDCEFVIASDVKNPLCGADGATYVFARQKGADDEMLPRLEQRNLRFCRDLEQRTGRRLLDAEGAGAAGGTGAALLSLPHVTMCPGIDLMLRWQHFEELIADADIVITGEGCLDRQTLMGKAPFGIAIRASERNVPCVALCGKVELSAADLANSPFTNAMTLRDFMLNPADIVELARL